MPKWYQILAVIAIFFAKIWLSTGLFAKNEVHSPWPINSPRPKRSVLDDENETSPETHNPLREELTDWWRFSEKKHTVVGLGLATLALLGLSLWLGTRPPEQVITTVEVPVKGKLVAVVVEDGEDLGIIGARFGRSRIEMIGYNVELLRENTAKCNRLGKTSGVCRRDDFGEEKLAPDAVWRGDVALIVTRDALDAPTLASTGQ